MTYTGAYNDDNKWRSYNSALGIVNLVIYFMTFFFGFKHQSHFLIKKKHGLQVIDVTIEIARSVVFLTTPEIKKDSLLMFLSSKLNKISLKVSSNVYIINKGHFSITFVVNQIEMAAFRACNRSVSKCERSLVSY